MPPKGKFTRDEIITAALDIVKEQGFSALTARALGAKLGSSARPIFSVFQSMDEVQLSVLDAARALYNQYIQNGLKQSPAFKGVGTQYILFAIQQPRLFQLLFMGGQGKAPALSSVLPMIDDNYQAILASVRDGYGLTKQASETIYRHLWIYTHGIATLCATDMCHFSAEEISTMMTEIFTSLLRQHRTIRG